jgi:hypothetical protein
MAAMPLLYGVAFKAPKYRSSGIAGDWRKVGGDLRHALDDHDETARTR